MTRSLIASDADISWAVRYPHAKPLHLMSNGSYVVLFEDRTSGSLFYAVSSDGGATWGAEVALPGGPSATNLNAIYVQADVLHLWYSGVHAQLYTSTYNTGTSTFGAQTVHTYTFPNVDAIDLVDAVYIGGFWHVSLSFNHSSRKGICVFRTPGFDGTLASVQQFLDLTYPHAGLNQLTIVEGTGFLYVSWYDTSRKKLYHAPVVLGDASYTWTPDNLEEVLVLTDTDVAYDMVQDSAGNQTIVLAHEGLLYSIVRTGARTWSTLVALQAQTATGQIPALYQDADDIYVAYETEVNEPNGETYFLKRSGSKWKLPVLIAGGSSAGFKLPVLINGSYIYEDTSYDLWFDYWTPYGTPNPPTNLAPVGNVGSLTPTLTWTSNRSASTDPPKSHEVETYRVSDSLLMDDSGEALGTGTSYVVPGGASLVYNTQYKFRVREKDSLSALGAGTWGPWSSYALFTPVRGATETINNVTSGTVTESSFPATIAGRDIQANVGHVQADGHAINAYRLNLYASDDASLIAQSTWHALGPPVVSGDDFDTFDWTPGVILNTHVYYLGVQVADATTGVLSESPHVHLTASFTPPDAVTDLAAAVDSDAGSVTLSWENPGAAVSVLVEWQPYSETGIAQGWSQIGVSGELWNQAVVCLQAPQTKADYRVTIYDALGIPSASESVTGVFLDNAMDYAAIWLNDVNAPNSRKVYVGAVDNYDSLKRDRAYAMAEWVPMGSDTPIHSFGLTSYWILGTSQAFKVFFDAVDVDSSGGLHYGADNRDRMVGLADSHATLLYRDRRFPKPLFVKLVLYEDQPNNDVHTDVMIELRQTSYFGPLPVEGSLL